MNIRIRTKTLKENYSLSKVLYSRKAYILLWSLKIRGKEGMYHEEMNEDEWADKFGEILMGPVIHKTWSPEDNDELKDMLNFESYIVLEDVWGKLRKILDNCKDNCKRQGILIALRIVEEKMTDMK